MYHFLLPGPLFLPSQLYSFHVFTNLTTGHLRGCCVWVSCVIHEFSIFSRELLLRVAWPYFLLASVLGVSLSHGFA